MGWKGYAFRKKDSISLLHYRGIMDCGASRVGAVCIPLYARFIVFHERVPTKGIFMGLAIIVTGEM